VLPSGDISQLSQDLAERRAAGEDGPLLFLGTKCGEAAGVPGPELMAPVVFTDLRRTDPKLSEALLPNPNPTEQESAEAFLRFLGGLSGFQRFRILQPFYARVPVPSFYQDLATLVATQYFRHILTTNVDSLFEQALMSQGLRNGIDFQVIVVSVPQSDRPQPTLIPDAPITLIKLHGDLGQSELPVTDAEIESAVRSQRRLVKEELTNEILMVGYEFESPPVEHWLGKMSGAPVWWISQEQPPQDRVAPIQAVREVRYVAGEEASPENFFGQLVNLLLRLPVITALNTSLEEFTSALPEAPADEAYGDVGSYLATSPGDDVEVELLKSQLHRSQAVKRQVERSLPTGESDPQIAAQLEYQRKQVSELEDQLRAKTQHRILELVSELSSSIDRALGNPDSGVDPDTAAFFKEQAGAVERETSKPSPNQHVLSAAIGSIVVLGDRLGRGVVSSNLLSELSSFAPGATS
jgi:hypothetical protein